MSERNEADFVADGVSLSPDEGTPSSTESTPPDAMAHLERENLDLKDQFLRMRAEFDNFRRRVAKEKEEIHEYASMEAVRPLLAIADDFERALAVECADSGYAKGMELIYHRMGEALRKMGVEPLPAKGHPFDPNQHHAIDMVKTADAPDNTVLDVFQQGYTFKGKLIRPAVVKVAVAPGESVAPNEDVPVPGDGA
ncbi:MAG: nucleotide exchange factor GrpE [Bryobacterales bacterium]|nr:nucleotide exchange factor GrpE [Bryobacterales bacterium]